MSNPDWEEVERAMKAVLELPEEERAAYLAQQTPAIRAEVESLLAARGGTPRISGETISNQAMAL